MKKKAYLMPDAKVFRLNLKEALLGASNEIYNLGNSFTEDFVDDEV